MEVNPVTSDQQTKGEKMDITIIEVYTPGKDMLFRLNLVPLEIKMTG